MILPIIIAIFGIVFLMIVHEFGHFIVAKKAGVKIEEFGIGYPPRIFGKKIGETVYSINLIPLGAFVKILGEEGLPAQAGGIEGYRSFVSLPMRKRAAIVLGGVISFWVAAAILFTVLFNIGVEVPISDEEILYDQGVKIRIVGSVPDSPAYIAGLRKKDIVIGTRLERNAELETINRIADFQQAIASSGGEEIIIVIQRGSDILEKPVTPRLAPPSGQGPLGVQLERMAVIIGTFSWYETPVRGVIYCGDITLKTVQGLGSIVSGLIKGDGLPTGAEPAGPIGITVFLARAVDFGAGFFIYFIAVIAVILAIFNLLPIPALDGGKLLFLVIEKIRSKAISPKVEQTVTTVFFFLLIAFSLFITIRFDIPRFSEFIRNGF